MCDIQDYKNFFNEAPVALCKTNIRTGKFEMANEFAAELFGCHSVEELMNNHVVTNFYPQVIRKKLIHRLRKQGVIENEEIELKLADEGETWIRANFRLTKDGKCIECFLMDITEVVKLREEHFQSLKILTEKIESQIESLAS